MDENQLSELYRIISEKDSTYQSRLPYEQFVEKMKDSAYVDKITQWAGIDASTLKKKESSEIQSGTTVSPSADSSLVSPSQDPKVPIFKGFSEEQKSDLKSSATEQTYMGGTDRKTPLKIRGVAIIPKSEEDFNIAIEGVNEKLIDQEEEYVVPDLQNRFGMYNFNFEKSGVLSDNVKVTSPTGETIEVPLDNWTDKGDAESSKELKDFMLKHKGKIDKVSTNFNDYEKRILSDKEATQTFARLNDEANNLNKSQNQAFQMKADIDRDREALSSMAQGTPEYKALYEKITSDDKNFELFATDIVEKEKMLSSAKQKLNRSVGRYSLVKEKQGDFSGALINKFLEGYGGIGAGIANYVIDAAGQFMPIKNLITPTGYREEFEKAVKKTGADVPKDMTDAQFNEWESSLTGEYRDGIDAEIRDQIKKGVKKEIVPEIRESVLNLLGDKGTTKEYTSRVEQSGIVNQGVLGLAGSLPAMIMPGGPAARVVSFFAMGTDAVMKEMEGNPEFDNISENEKLLISTPIGIANAVLEEFGLRNALGSSGVVNNLIMKAIGKSSRTTTAKTFSELIKNEVEDGLSRGLLTVTAGALAEGETGAAQQVAEYAVKDIYNAVKEKQMFNTPSTVKEYITDVVEAGLAEAVGGFVMTVPGAIANGYNKNNYNGVSDETVKKFGQIANDGKIMDAYVVDIKNRITSGEITTEQAKEEMDGFRKSIALYNAIPEGVADKRKSLSLLSERSSIQAKIQNKDEALTKPQRERIAEINTELENLSREVVLPEQVAEEVKPREEKVLPEGYTLSEAINEDGEVDYEADDELRKIAKERGLGITSDREVSNVVRDENGNIVGGAFTSTDSEGNYTFDVVVSEQAEGKGIGSIILDQVASMPQELTEVFPNAKMKVDVVSPTMRAMLEDRGFEVTEQIGMDRVIMEKKSDEVVSSRTQDGGVSVSNKASLDGLMQNTTDEMKRSIISSATKAVNTLKSVLPNFDIVIHDNEDDYNAHITTVKGRENSAGNFSYSKNEKGEWVGRIDINLNKANARTVAHEVAHGVMLKAFNDSQEVFKDFRSKISKVLSDDTNARLNNFASQYSEDESHQEFLVELTAALTANKQTLSKVSVSKIAQIINELVSKLTNGAIVPFKDTQDMTDINEVIDFLNNVSGAIGKGSEINDLGLHGVINSGASQGSKSAITNELNRFDIHENASIEYDVPLSRFNGIDTNVFESDRMTAAYINDNEGNVFFKFFGGVLYPYATGKWWASRDERTAKIIVNNSNGNRNQDGYIYGTPLVGSPTQHMSNTDMLMSTIMLMKQDVLNKKSSVTKVDVISYIDKAFERVDLRERKILLKGALKKSNTIEKVFDELSLALFNDDNKFSFEERKDIVVGLLGDPKVKVAKFPSVGSITDVAKKFEEPITSKANEIGDIVTVMRTKGILKYRTTSPTDEDSHKSYPVEIYAVNEDGTTAKVEVFVLSKAHPLREVIPSIKRKDGSMFTWEEYQEKHGKVSKDYAIAQYARTAGKLTKGSGKITSKSQVGDTSKDENKIINLQNGTDKKQNKGNGTLEKNKEQVRYNGTDAIGQRSRTESDKAASRQKAKEKISSLQNNASREAANDYNKSIGLPEIKTHEFQSSNKDTQTKIGEIYQQLKDVTFSTYKETELERKIFDSYKSEYLELFKKYNIKSYKDLVEKSYAEFAKEANAQFEALNIKIEFHEGESNYQSSAEMLDDVHNFGHLWVFKGGEDHTLLGSKTADKDGITANDKFRAVHDYFGHSVEGYQFGKNGEENAWIEHSKMFSPLAQIALSSESRGQNSFVNYSGVNDVALEKMKVAEQLTKKGLAENNPEMIAAGEMLLNEANNEFQFAEQKSVVLPKKYTDAKKYFVKQLLTTKTTKNEKANEDGEQKRRKDGEEDVTESVQSEGENGRKKINLQEKQVLGTEGAAEAAPITSKSQVDEGSVGVDVESIKKKIETVVPKNELFALAVSSLPKKGKINYKDINKTGNPLANYLNNPKFALERERAKEIYNDIKAGKELKYPTILLDENNKLLDGTNRTIARLANGITDFDYAVAPKGFLGKPYAESIAEAYIKAKADGSNPELVKAVEQSLKETTKAGSGGVGREVIGKYKVTIAFKSKFGGLSYKSYEFNNKAHFDNWFKKNGSKFDISEIYEPTSKSQITVNETTNPGYDNMMGKVDGIIEKSMDRGSTYEQIMDAVMGYMQTSLVYEKATDQEREQMVRDVREAFGLKEKNAPSVGRILGTIKDIKSITATEKSLLKKQIQDYARGARESKDAWRKANRDLRDAVLDLKKKGKITTSQLMTVLRKFVSVNMFNPESIEKFVDYMEKVFNDAEYAEKISRLRKLAKRGKKNIKTKIGISSALFPLLNKMLSIDASLIPDSVMETFVEMVEMVGTVDKVLALKDRLEVTRKVAEVLDAVDEEHSIVDGLKDAFDNFPNKVFDANGVLDYAATIEAMTTVIPPSMVATISSEDAKLMKKWKSRIVTNAPATPKTQAELDAERNQLLLAVSAESVDASLLPTAEERKAATRISDLLKEEEYESLTSEQLTTLLKVISNINNGYLPHQAQLLIEAMEKGIDSIVLESSIKRAKILPVSGFVARVKSMLKKDSNAIEMMIRRAPLFYMDQLFGDFKSRDIFNSVFKRLSSGITNYQSEMKIIEAKIEKAIADVANSLGKSPNAVMVSSYKMMTYMLQLEHDSNPDSKQVNQAKAFIDATIKHIRKTSANLSTNPNSPTGDKTADALQQIINDYSVGINDASGDKRQIDASMLYNSFNFAEKAAIKVIQEINAGTRDKAIYTSHIVRGDKLNPIDNYVHHHVLPISNNQQNISGITTATQFNNMTQPSTRGKSLIARTGTVNALDFNVFNATQRGANYVMLDYYLTEPIRIARKTMIETEKLLEESDASNSEMNIFNGIKNSLELAIDNTLTTQFHNNSFADEVVKFLTKNGYRTALASTTRFVGELSSNMGFIMINNRKEWLLGVNEYRDFVLSGQAIDVMINLGSTATTRVVSNDQLSGRLVDSSVMSATLGTRRSTMKGDAHNALLTIYNKTLKPYKNFVELVADNLISTPDKIMMRPLWFGMFATKFKEMTGQKPDMDKIASNDETYMTEFRSELAASRDSADEGSVVVGASNNPFMGILKGANTSTETNSAVKMFNIFNNYMTTFLQYEYAAARTGIHAAMGDGIITRKQGVALMAAVTTRMTLYTLLTGMLSNGLLSLFGADEDDEDEKSLMQKLGQALASSATGILLGRDFGNAMRGVINYGVEAVNEEMLTGLRNDEYDPYTDAISYSPLITSKDDKGQSDMKKLFINMLGPLSPVAKTTDLLIKSITAAPKKEEDAIQRASDEMTIRLPLEVLGNLGLVPVYKDVRKVVLKSIYQSLENPPKVKTDEEKRFDENPRGMTRTDLERYFPDEYEKYYGEGSKIYEDEKFEKKIEKIKSDLERKIKDEKYNYIKPKKEKKKPSSWREDVEASSDTESSTKKKKRMRDY